MRVMVAGGESAPGCGVCVEMARWGLRVTEMAKRVEERWRRGLMCRGVRPEGWQVVLLGEGLRG